MKIDPDKTIDTESLGPCWRRFHRQQLWAIEHPGLQFRIKCWDAHYKVLKAQLSKVQQKLKRMKFFRLSPRLLKSFYRGVGESIVRWNAPLLPELMNRQKEKLITASKRRVCIVTAVTSPAPQLQSSEQPTSAHPSKSCAHTYWTRPRTRPISGTPWRSVDLRKG